MNCQQMIKNVYVMACHNIKIIQFSEKFNFRKNDEHIPEKGEEFLKIVKKSIELS